MQGMKISKPLFSRPCSEQVGGVWRQLSLPLWFSLALAAILGCLQPAAADQPQAPQAQPTEPAPRLVWDHKQFDFRKAVSGTTLEHAYRFVNKGDAVLEIRKVKPSCGCTAALLSAPQVKPGESGLLRVRFDTRDRRGPQHIQIHVYSNDALERDQGENVSILHLKGTLETVLEVLPQAAYFPSFLAGTEQVREVTVLPKDCDKVVVKAVRCDNPFVRVSHERFVRQEKLGFRLRIALITAVPTGRVQGMIHVETDHVRQPSLAIRVFGLAHGRLVCFPDRVQLMPTSEPASREAVVTLQRVSGEPGIAIDHVEAPAGFSVAVQEIIPGKRTELLLKLDDGLAPGPRAGLLRVFCRDRDDPYFEVPVFTQLEPKVVVSPRHVWLGSGKLATVLVHVPAGFNVTKAEVVRGGLSATLRKAEDGLSYVDIGLVAGSAESPTAGLIDGQIRIHTDVPGEPTIDVSVGGLVVPKAPGS